MKKFIAFSLLIFVFSQIIAQIPQSFNYQAVVRDNSGNVLTNQNISVQISIIPEGTYSIPVYSEVHNLSTNQFGLFSVKIGEGDSLKGNFKDIHWWNGTFFLQTAIDTSGGTNYQILGSTQLVSVPYALYSKGLILTDENGHSYQLAVDENGNLSTNQVFSECGDDFTDPRDGHTYGTVRIGGQCWMTTNLNYGQQIDSLTQQSNNGVVEKYCYHIVYSGVNFSICDENGGLYMWDEMMQYSTDSVNQGICPEGWRIPTDYDWKVLEGTTDGQYGIGDSEWNSTGWRGSDAGGNLKAISSIWWLTQNTGATDAFGFSSLGSGWWDGSAYHGARTDAYQFTSVESSSSNVYIHALKNDLTTIYRGDIPKNYAASVRCIYNQTYPNTPPNTPSNPDPNDGANNITTSPTLLWACNDPDNEALRYNIYLGTNSNPASVASNLTTNSYTPSTLQAGVTYYWKIEASDQVSTVESQIWSFTTTTDQAPLEPNNPNPTNQSTNIEPTINLSWTCSDPENDPLDYHVYFGKDNPPDNNATTQNLSFDPGELEMGTTYYWKIIADDGILQTESQVWSFTTLSNDPPNMPFNPMPADNQVAPWNTDIKWSCNDPDNDVLTYDIFYGQGDPSNMIPIASDIADTSYTVPASLYGENNYWQIIAHDQYFQTEGDIWSFHADYPPLGPPENPNPADGAVDVSIFTEFSYDCEVHDIVTRYFACDTTPSLPLETPLPDELLPSTKYYWQVTVVDLNQRASSGPIWSFTTSNNSPPNKPNNIYPENNTLLPRNNPFLIWTCADPQNDALTYNVYYGTSNPPPLVSENQADTSYTPAVWQANTTYYWKIISNDGEYQAESDLWNFSTSDNYAPEPASSPSPANNEVGTSIFISNLSWEEASDLDNDALSYQVYFGTSEPINQIGSTSDTTYDLSNELLVGTQYFWRIDSYDGSDITIGDSWTFTTNIDNPPAEPSSPSPTNNTNYLPLNTTISWQCSDPDLDALSYNVYFGTSSTPPLVSQGQNNTNYNPGILDYSTNYYWKIIVSDGIYSIESEVWQFETESNTPPSQPYNPSPANITDNVSINTTLSWSCDDNETDTTTYDVYFGILGNLSLVSEGQLSTSYNPGVLANSTQYSWKIIASDGTFSTEGQEWTFHTEQ